MKKNYFLLAVMFSVVLFSCGGKSSSKKDGSEGDKQKVVTDCNISELTNLDQLKEVRKTGSKELFTGTAVEKDQFDKIIREVHVKNGWLTEEIITKKIQNDYVVISDYNYENGTQSNGWQIEIADDFINKDYIYVTNFRETKGDNVLNNWRVKYFSTTNGNQIAAVNLYKNGVSLVDYGDNKDRCKPKCFIDSEFELDEGWSYRDISPEKYAELLKSLKEEFPHFNYWKK